MEHAEKVQALVNEWTRRRLLRNIPALFHPTAALQNVSDLTTLPRLLLRQLFDE